MDSASHWMTHDLPQPVLPPEQAAELLPWYMQWSRDLAAKMHRRCYGAAPIVDSVHYKNELRDLVLRVERGRVGRHTGLTEG